MDNTTPQLKLPYGFEFADLYDAEALPRLDAAFLDFLGGAEPELRRRLAAARDCPDGLAVKDESELLIAVAPHLEDFLASLFGIETEVQALAARHHALAPLYTVKRQFVMKRAVLKIKGDAAAAVDGDAVEGRLAALFGEPFSELVFARHVTEWLKDEEAHAEPLDMAAQYAACAAGTPAGRAKHGRETDTLWPTR